MKTPSDLALAEFVAGLLKFTLTDDYCWFNWKPAYVEFPQRVSKGNLCTFIFDGRFSPIIRHLIEKEMGNREWAWEELKQAGKPQEYVCHFMKDDEEYSKTAFDKNKTRAVALAAYRTGER